MFTIIADLHCHTRFSYDSSADPEEVIRFAVGRKIGIIALTDHYDVDFADCGMSMELNFSERKKCILELKDKYRGKIRIIFGIELGQPYNNPDLADSVIKENGFEFVLGSVHNLKNVPDFYYFDYVKMSEYGSLIRNLYSRYLDDILKLTELPYINSVAHVTYPLRYLRKAGLDYDLSVHYLKYEEIFKNIVKTGKYLEINSSGVRNNSAFTMPDDDLLEIYARCGGKYVTIGSDAHCERDVGAGFAEAAAKAKKFGLDIISDIKELY